MIRRPAPAILALALLFAAAACDVAQPSGPGGSGGTSSLGPGDTGSASSASESSSATEPASTSIPGFDGWATLNPGSVDIGATQSGFGMTLTRRAQWSGASRGVLFYTTIDGSFRLTATVRSSRTSDSSQDPGGDGTIQMGGLMARLGGSSESWVLLEVGGDVTGLALATDSTTDGRGRLVTSTWGDNEADLKLCRVGTTFTFWARAADSDDDWTAVGQVERRDLAGVVQVGASLSASGAPDLTALFDNLTLDPMDPGEAC